MMGVPYFEAVPRDGRAFARCPVCGREVPDDDGRGAGRHWMSAHDPARKAAEGNALGRCRPCDTIWWWEPGTRLLRAGVFCPDCGGRLRQTTLLAEVARWAPLPAEVRS